MTGVRISFEDLQLITGFKRPTSLARWLRQEAIAFSLDHRGLPWTTLPAVRRARVRRGAPARYPCADLALDF